MNLAILDRARTAIAKAATVDEAKEIRDKAEALRTYARQAKCAGDMERQCVVIRLRAERRIGQLLAGTVRAGNPQLSPGVTIGLSKLGITRNQSSKWQFAAILPEAQFERYVETAREPTTKGIIRIVQEQLRNTATGPRSGGHILTGPASQLWDRLADSSVDLFLTDPPYYRNRTLRRVGGTGGSKVESRRFMSRLCRAGLHAQRVGGDGATPHVSLDFRNQVFGSTPACA